LSRRLKVLTVAGNEPAFLWVKVNQNALLRLERRNEMLGLGLLGTIIVVLVIVWLVRRV
jgi:hypothetical protein